MQHEERNVGNEALNLPQNREEEDDDADGSFVNKLHR